MIAHGLPVYVALDPSTGSWAPSGWGPWCARSRTLFVFVDKRGQCSGSLHCAVWRVDSILLV